MTAEVNPSFGSKKIGNESVTLCRIIIKTVRVIKFKSGLVGKGENVRLGIYGIQAVHPYTRDIPV